MSQQDPLTTLIARIDALERSAGALVGEATSDDVRGKLALLLASLRGARAALAASSDEAALVDSERVVDAVDRHLSELAAA